jgi:hypothetical protein
MINLDLPYYGRNAGDTARAFLFADVDVPELIETKMLFWWLCDWKEYAKYGGHKANCWVVDRVWTVLQEIQGCEDQLLVELAGDIELVFGKYFRNDISLKGTDPVLRRSARRFEEIMEVVHDYINDNGLRPQE